jgi:hypothetical protein
VSTMSMNGANETSEDTPKRAHPWAGWARMEFFIFFCSHPVPMEIWVF